MKRSAILICLLTLVAWFFSSSAHANQPNIVLILADDLGWADTTLYGQTELYETPNLERLAARGMTFSNAYSSHPLCSPTRSSILSGQNPARTGFTSPAGHVPEVRYHPEANLSAQSHFKAKNVKSSTRLDPSKPTLAKLLKEAGYTTGHIGKWHLGAAPHSALDFGFDVDIPNYNGSGPGRTYLAPWSIPGLEGEPGEHIEDRMAQEAIHWLKNRDRTKPFFMNYWQFSVHAPFGAKPELIDRYRPKIDRDSEQTSPTYAAMVHSMDEGVGALLEAIDAEGIADETIIIFTSDNGGNVHCGLEETDLDGETYITPITSNAPLRGGKGNIRDGGIRVPAVVVWPGVTEPGSRNETRIQSLDLYPTILKLTGTDLPSDYPIDGYDFTEALKGKELDREPMFTYVPSYGNTPQWLPPSMAVHHGDWKLIRTFHHGENGGHEYRLYNLKDDIGESHNLAAEQPETVQRLDAMIDQFVAEAEVLLPDANHNFDPAKFDPSTIGVQAGGLKMPPAAKTPGEPAPMTTVKDPALQGWIARGAKITSDSKRVMITPTGRQAFIATNQVRSEGPTRVTLQIRGSGKGSLQWRTEDQEEFPKGQVRKFTVEGSDWTKVTVPLDVEGKLVQLRVFPPNQTEKATGIAWIEVTSTTSGNSERWDFGKEENAAPAMPQKAAKRQPKTKKQPPKTAVTPPASQPNFVFIFADDFGYGDLACYGHPYARTPNIDQLAAEGTRFTQAYAAGQTCNPSRTGLMTGISNARFAKRTDDFDFGDRITITELLNNNGYATGHFGKWHIGMDRSNGIYGIDENDSGGRPDRFSPEGRDTPIFEAAIDFIQRHKDEPFYVNIWGFTTHSPVASAPNFLTEFQDVKVNREDFSPYMQSIFDDSIEIGGDLDLNMRHYLGNVFALDLNVKSVLDALDELGLSDNTVVVFSSDQGPQRPYGIGLNATGSDARDKIVKTRDGRLKESHDLAKNMLGDAGVFKGNKGTVYEGGVRIPFIIRWPGTVEAGVVDNENVIGGIDWLSSICSLAGVSDIPDDLDGEDVSDMWLGATRPRSKPLMWNGNPGIAIRDGEWKYYLGIDRGKVTESEELYHVLNDPAESQNLIETHPEVAASMKEKAISWKAELPETVIKTGNYRHQY